LNFHPKSEAFVVLLHILANAIMFAFGRFKFLFELY